MKLFSEVKNKNDIEKLLLDKYSDISKNYFKSLIESGLKSLKELNQEKEKVLLTYTNSIDTYFGNKEKNEDNNKYRTLLSIAIIIDKNYSDVEKLDDKELLSLAFFLAQSNMYNMEEYVKFFDKDILDLLCSKFNKYSDRQMILELIDNKISTDEITTKDKVKKFISTIENDDLNNYYQEYVNELGGTDITGGVRK